MDAQQHRVARLRALIDAEGGAARFARNRSLPGADKPIDPTHISQILNGHRAFGEKAAAAMAARAGLAPGYFDADSEASQPSEPGSPSDQDYALIPQYSARAGCGLAYHNGHVEIKGGLVFKRDWLARMGLKPDNLSVVAAHGDSMAPTVQNGEVLLLDHSETEPRDGQVFALDRGGELLVKRLMRDFASNGWIVRSDNPDKARFGDIPVSDEALRVVARVVWRGGGL